MNSYVLIDYFFVKYLMIWLLFFLDIRLLWLGLLFILIYLVILRYLIGWLEFS